MNSKEAFEVWKRSVLKRGYSDHEIPTAAFDAGWQAALEWAVNGQTPVGWCREGDLQGGKLFDGAYISDIKAFVNYLPLYLHPAPVLSGWKLVPIDPTEEMLQEACDCQDADPKDGCNSEMYYTYKAMLDAAPEWKP